MVTAWYDEGDSDLSWRCSANVWQCRHATKIDTTRILSFWQQDKDLHLMTCVWRRSQQTGEESIEWYWIMITMSKGVHFMTCAHCLAERSSVNDLIIQLIIPPKEPVDEMKKYSTMYTNQSSSSKQHKGSVSRSAIFAATCIWWLALTFSLIAAWSTSYVSND